MRVALYHDPRLNNAVLLQSLMDHFGTEAIVKVEADDIKAGILDDSISAFFMPGGADRYYAELLNGEGNAALHTYVKSGGSYVGICAGAYYACRALFWREGQADEISGPRELGFFKGSAHGPIPEWTLGKADCALAEVAGPLGQASLYYWGGPLFKGDLQDVDVLARYTALPDQPAAILKGRFGKGQWLLSSAHAEYSGAALRNSVSANDPFHTQKIEIAQQLEAVDPARALFWQKLLEVATSR